MTDLKILKAIHLIPVSVNNSFTESSCEEAAEPDTTDSSDQDSDILGFSYEADRAIVL